MKWMKRMFAALFAIVAVVLVVAVANARRSENPVGFRMVRVESPSGPVAVALWYPTAATPRPTTFVGGDLLSVARDAELLGDRVPVVLISHGNGGSALSHVDLAMELASAGYLVAAPTHAGDNFADQSRQGSAALFNERAGQVRATLDHLFDAWPGVARVDPARVGAYGMSAGGFTVLTLAGAAPDMAAIAEHCRKRPEFICEALAHVQSPLLQGAAEAGTFSPDDRIRAAVVAAPGLGFTFANGGMDGVRVPVQVWSGERDETVPYASNAKIVEDGLGARAEAHRVPAAAHLSFLAPCGLLRPAAVCSDPEGFDREAAHVAMNAEILRFFAARLAPASPSPTAP